LINNVDYLDFPLNQDFIVAFSGFIEVKQDACYSFGIYTPAVAKLFIGEREVVDKQGSNGAKERTGQIVLAQGKHRFKLLCMQRGNEYDRILKLTCNWNGKNKKSFLWSPTI